MSSAMSASPIDERSTLLEQRYDMSADDLSNHIRQNFSGSLLSLKQLEPFIREMLRRFKRLPRKVGVDGKRRPIAGCTTFKMWCRTVLNRQDRTVRYMLAGGSKPKATARTERISAHAKAPAQIREFLDKQVSFATGAARRQLVTAIQEAADFYSRQMAAWKKTEDKQQGDEGIPAEVLVWDAQGNRIVQEIQNPRKEQTTTE